MTKIKNVKKNQSKEDIKYKRIYKTYGITRQEYEKKLEEQKGVCAVCHDKPGTGRLCIDHAHVSGFKKMDPSEKRKYVRGICCFLCNTGFKGFEKTKDGEKNRQRLEGTYKYFKKYQLKGEL